MNPMEKRIWRKNATLSLLNPFNMISKSVRIGLEKEAGQSTGEEKILG
jgi:hypothetical protein